MNKKLFFVAAALTVAASFITADAQTRRVIHHKRPVHKKVIKKMPAPLETGAVKTPSGLTYLITHKGTGAQAKAGQMVTVHYTGTLLDGTKFDSSRDAGVPFSFPLGAGRVIKGWDEGIGKLHIGDQAILVIPPTLGYGERGAGGVIPPNATLIFIVELLDAKDKP